MLFEKFLKQYWRCVDIETVDECEAFYQNKADLIGHNIYISGFRLEYDMENENTQEYLSFNVWIIKGSEIIQDCWVTEHLIELREIDNGFMAITGDFKDNITTYTFKETSINPIEQFLLSQN